MFWDAFEISGCFGFMKVLYQPAPKKEQLDVVVEGQNNLSKKKNTQQNPGKVTIFRIFLLRFSIVFFFLPMLAVDPLGSGMLRCLPANCGRLGCGVIDSGQS